MIRTPEGEQAIETLAIGDMVMAGRPDPAYPLDRTADDFDCVRRSVRVHPIRIRRGALGEGLPVRDLLVSSDHAMLVDDILIRPARW